VKDFEEEAHKARIDRESSDEDNEKLMNMVNSARNEKHRREVERHNEVYSNKHSRQHSKRHCRSHKKS
jgi:hypothetical protein